MGEALLTARRGRRDSFVLGAERGVYALFLCPGSDLPLTAGAPAAPAMNSSLSL